MAFSLELLLNGLMGAGLFAEPCLQQLFGEGAQSLWVALGIDISLEALNLKRLRHGELDRSHRVDAMGQVEVMGFRAEERHVDYTIRALSATQDDD